MNTFSSSQKVLLEVVLEINIIILSTDSNALRQQDLALAVCVFNQIHIREGMTLERSKNRKSLYLIDKKNILFLILRNLAQSLQLHSIAA